LFYAYGEPIYLFLLLGSSVLNYVCARLVRSQNQKRKGVLIFTVISNLGILGFFKYAGMLVETVNSLGSFNLSVPEIPLPIGISFFTFQAMSYVIDVYQGKVDAQKNYAKVLLYISFFPQLIAGPIIKYRDISYYIDNRKMTVEQTSLGMRRFIVGLSKKVLIANTVGLVADNMFSASLSDINIVGAWIGAIAYMLQIYYDFSAYSDMAIGLGGMFGFEITENFNYPYISSSVKEFWRRWHISLSSWFKEYLYIPLGGNRKGKWRTRLNKLIVFFCTGLWHGASWTFVVWGLYHGLFLTLEDIFKNHKKLPAWIRHLYLLVVICVGFVIFRADTMSQALYFIAQMFTGFHFSTACVSLALEQLTRNFIVAVIVGCIFACPIKEKITENPRLQILSYVGTTVLLVICVVHLSGSTYNPFIYFRF
jgi:alginate O-acetyltransferase complex protein AlgI